MAPNRTVLYIGATVLILFILWNAGAASPATHPAPENPAPAVVLDAPPAPGPHRSLSADELQLLAWAEDRFELVGLELPPVEVSFHDDTRPCGGHNGLYQGPTGAATVLVCVPDRDTAAFDLQRQRTLVHELAHAWEQANLDDATRRELLPILDAESWYAPTSDWDQRGAERFAETIVWGLYDQLRRPALIDVSCRELHADFLAITGTTAPGPLELVCRLEDRISSHEHR